jgi:hypothetical protein
MEISQVRPPPETYTSWKPMVMHMFGMAMVGPMLVILLDLKEQLVQLEILELKAQLEIPDL